MREILFRGRIGKKGAWRYGDLLFRGHGLPYIRVRTDGTQFQVDSDTIGQYTGLKDKNGTKIFEGDILKEDDLIHNDEVQVKGLAWIVEERTGCWIARVPRTEGWSFLFPLLKCSEVIGNIHDNEEE